MIRVLTKRVWGVESRKEEVQKELSATQQKLCELEHKQQNISQQCQDFEARLTHNYTFMLAHAAFRLTGLWCLLGEEPESELHAHGFVH